MSNKSSFLFIIKFLIALTGLAGGRAWAAACCGGGLAVPALITGDDRALFAGTYSVTSVDTDVSDSGVWKKRSEVESSQVLRLEGAWIVQDRGQFGASIPVMRRSRGSESEQGLGDVALNAGYEYLPDWDYNPWRPKGIGFLQLTLPTGRSIYEAADDQLQTRGRGFWALGAGTSLTKIWGVWDASSLLEAHRAFGKKVSSSEAGGDLSVEPGWGGSLEVGAGWNRRDWRLGTAIVWNYEDPIDVSGAITSKGSVQRFATATLTANYFYSTQWTGSVSYADQAVFGSPVNTTLGKSVLLSLQHHWER